MRISFDPFGYQNFSLINEQLAVITVFHISLIREFVRASEHPDFSGQSGKKVSKVVKICNVRESNPGLPRGRREFYH